MTDSTDGTNPAKGILLHDLLIFSSQLEGKDLVQLDQLIKRFGESLRVIEDNIYLKLNTDDRAIFILWFLKRWGDIQLVHDSELLAYDQVVSLAKSAPWEEFSVCGRPYRKVNYSSQGYDLDIIQYPWVLGIHDFYYNQYEHGPVIIEKGDVIIDAGAFIGDTAVLFNHKAEGQCEVHCFELLDENLELLRANVKLNKLDEERVFVNQLALSDRSGEILEIKNHNIQGATKVDSNTSLSPGSSNSIGTISIDDYVRQRSLDRVDMIKMDIEGAELQALKGATETIRKHRPKLAICLYHLPADPVKLPKLLNEIDCGYQFFFKWAHLRSGWEAVLLAHPDARSGINERDSNTHPDSELSSALLNVLSQFSLKYSQADNLWKSRRRPLYLRAIERCKKYLKN
ncbi:FkbM family methyltransferase [Seongchinamella unica]|uniref:FkbM family methyltransferase n=1 Tax=Seongchinamella unica TaxID=2547392 RepID=A0A4R5LN40_9GAMM|nr:FkbM family methyltransferase [Seongchinamella unica]TDG11621.1 FkbM family methyltransferase [Seongchinamella unica]